MPNRIEEAVTKGAGKVKAATARVKGLKGIFNHLAEEHAQAGALLKMALSASDADKQQDLWSELRLELLSHERAEVAEVYPALERFPKMRSMLETHEAEAQKLEAAIAELDRTPYATETWHRRLHSLEQLINKHVDEEENEFFPAAQEQLDQSTVADLEPRFERAKQAAKTGLGR
jgi:hypothetical protein